ncbi:tail fiber domain-containing protein [Cupriavidus sp. WS]|uniref:tail fiber domain-containing protein n=1 Tax=Cupriavidus sp. WS TaxID=1312922 RepID=UPI00037E8E68|nr:tail fiber domain-containing protein [Cupriavidus sp. WS]
MAKQVIDLGTPPGASDGDTSRTAFTKTKANFDELYARAQGRLSKDIGGGAGLVSLTAEEVLYGVIELTGEITGNREVAVPAEPVQSWIVRNSTVGAYTVKFRTQGGEGVVIERGGDAVLRTDGSDVLDVDAALRASMQDKVDQEYVDDGLAAKADKTYVDNGLNGKLAKNPGMGGGTFLRGDGAFTRSLGTIYQSHGFQPGYEYLIPAQTACMTYLLSSGDLVFANSDGTASWVGTRAVLSGGGNLALSGTLSQGSDVRIKANIRTLEGALSKVRSIRGVTYQRMLPSVVKFDESGGPELPPKLSDPEIGVIAQEVQTVCPELVKAPDPVSGNLAVMYGNMVGLLVQAINELADKHDQAVARIEALEAQ